MTPTPPPRDADDLPVAWTRTDSICDDSGCPIGTDEPRVVWGSEHPDPGPGGEAWWPLYDGPSPSSEARPIVVYQATSAGLQSAYFGEWSAARAWAGKNGHVTMHTIDATPELRAVPRDADSVMVPREMIERLASLQNSDLGDEDLVRLEHLTDDAVALLAASSPAPACTCADVATLRWPCPVHPRQGIVGYPQVATPPAPDALRLAREAVAAMDAAIAAAENDEDSRSVRRYARENAADACIAYVRALPSGAAAVPEIVSNVLNAKPLDADLNAIVAQNFGKYMDGAAAVQGEAVEHRKVAGPCDPGYDAQAYEYARGWNDCVDTHRYRARRATPLAKSDGRGAVDAFDAGWHLCAKWANRDDLHADTDSPAYKRDRAAALAALGATP